MKIFFKNIPQIGELRIEHVFYEYDRPALFTCLDRNNTRYLCSCCKLGEEWLLSQIQTDMLIAMIENKLPIRNALKSGRSKIAIFWDGHQVKTSDRIPSDMYPMPYSYLDGSDDTKNVQYKAYLKSLS